MPLIIKRLPALLLFLCALTHTHADTTDQEVVFTLPSLFETIEQRSSTLKVADLDISGAEAAVDVQRAAWLPNANASLQVGYLGDGLLTDRDFGESMKVKNPHFVNNFSLEASQLIYDATVKHRIQGAKLNSELAQISKESDRERIRFSILANLIDLETLRRQRTVIENNIALARQVLETMRTRLENGVVLKSDVTRYELHIDELTLQLDRNAEAIKVTDEKIATTLHYDSGTRFRLVTDSIDENTPLTPLAEWQQMAFSSNPEVLRAMKYVSLGKNDESLVKAARMPQLNAFIYGQLASPIVTEVPIINKNFMFWGFGVNLSYNISTLYKNPQRERLARYAVMQSEERVNLVKEGIEDNITSAYFAYGTAQSKLRTTRSALKLAYENYDIISERFNEGMALVTDLVDAANLRLSSQLDLESSVSRLKFSLFRLKYLSNTL